ncbi:MAG: DUF3307 domain-containing protein [Pseudomonadota bacterium]
MPGTSLALLVVLVLQIKHLVADFGLQSRYILDNRRIYGHPGGLVHVGIHAAGTLIVLVPFGFPFLWVGAIIVGEALVHYHLDWAKDNLVAHYKLDTASKGYWILLGSDQALHQASYLLIAWLLVSIGVSQG